MVHAEMFAFKFYASEWGKNVSFMRFFFLGNLGEKMKSVAV